MIQKKILTQVRLVHVERSRDHRQLLDSARSDRGGVRSDGGGARSGRGGVRSGRGGVRIGLHLYKYIVFTITVLLFSGFKPNPPYGFQIALLKYNGGGDWYSNLETSLPNLIKYCNDNIKTNINPEQAIIDVGSAEIFNYPFVHMTGHGNVIFSNQEAENLRNYLLAGGFLHVSDNFGMDKFVRTQLKKVFPELDLVELPFNHPVYHQKYDFPNGLPKIHEHENAPPKGFGLIYKGRLVCFYDFECDLGDGWESAEIHHDSEEARTKALKMGANLISYAFTSLDKKN